MERLLLPLLLAAALLAPAPAFARQVDSAVVKTHLEEQIRRCQLLRPDGCVQSYVGLASGQAIRLEPSERAPAGKARRPRSDDPLAELKPAAGLIAQPGGPGAPAAEPIRKAPAQLEAIEKRKRW